MPTVVWDWPRSGLGAASQQPPTGLEATLNRLEVEPFLENGLYFPRLSNSSRRLFLVFFFERPSFQTSGNLDQLKVRDFCLRGSFCLPE